jgi:hypothetical protein
MNRVFAAAAIGTKREMGGQLETVSCASAPSGNTLITGLARGGKQGVSE